MSVVSKAELTNSTPVRSREATRSLTCQDTFRIYDCQKKIDEAGSSKNFIDCSSNNFKTLKNAANCSVNFAVGAGVGYLTWVAPQVVLPVVGGLITYSGLKKEEECFYDTEKKLKMARPLAAIHNQQYAETVAKRLSCIELNRLVLETSRNHLGRIFEKQLNQERYEKELARRPNRQRALQRIYPEAKRVLTNGEARLLQVMNQIKAEEEKLKGTIQQINENFRCASIEYKTKLICGIVGGTILPASLLTSKMANRVTSQASTKPKSTARTSKPDEPPKSGEDLSESHLVGKESFEANADGIDQNTFVKILNGIGREKDGDAIQLVGGELNHAPKPGTVPVKTTAVWKREKDPLRLLTPDQIKALPDGTVVESISGEKLIKGVDYIDLDTRGGFSAFGFRQSKIESGVGYVGEVSGRTKADMHKLVTEKEKAASLKKLDYQISSRKETMAMEDLSNGVTQSLKGQSVPEFARKNGYTPLQHEFWEGFKPIPGKKSIEGLDVIIEYEKRNGTSYNIRGTVTRSYPAGVTVRDSSGTLHEINMNYGTIKGIFAKDPSKGVLDPVQIVKTPTGHLDAVRGRTRVDLATTNRNITNISTPLQYGRRLLQFTNQQHQRTFFRAAQSVRERPIRVQRSRQSAIEQNINTNKSLGRSPVRIDANGIPVYSPGPSLFRAMVVTPNDRGIAQNILVRDGWKSGSARGVDIPKEKLGSAGNGATRLNGAAPFEDNVVEFVGPNINLGPNFQNGFAFPKDSRVVGVATSSKVVDVAKMTATDAPEGSFIMLTEIVPRNKIMVNSNQLMKGRGLESKFPTVYEDGGIEYALPEVSADEIVNVIFIPLK